MSTIQVSTFTELKTACEGAASGDIVELINDIDMSNVDGAGEEVYMIKVKANLTINGNGYLITDFSNQTTTFKYFFYTGYHINIYGLHFRNILNTGVLYSGGNTTTSGTQINGLSLTGHYDIGYWLFYAKGLSATHTIKNATFSITGSNRYVVTSFTNIVNCHINYDIALTRGALQPFDADNVMNCSITGSVRGLEASPVAINFASAGRYDRYTLIDLDVSNTYFSVNLNLTPSDNTAHYSVDAPYSLIYIRGNTNLTSITNNGTSAVYNPNGASINGLGFMATSEADLKNKENFTNLGWSFDS